MTLQRNSFGRSNTRARVYVPPAEANGWALETDRQMLLRALVGWSQPTDDLAEAHIVHSVWWQSMLEFPAESLLGKRILCQFSGEPRRTVQQPKFRHVVPRVGRWIAQTRQACNQLEQFGLPFTYVPYSVDTNVYFPNQVDRQDARTQWNLPSDRYLIGSFQRDTEGADLTRPQASKRAGRFVGNGAHIASTRAADPCRAGRPKATLVTAGTTGGKHSVHPSRSCHRR